MKLTTYIFIMNQNYLVSNLVVGDMVRFTNPLFACLYNSFDVQTCN